MSKKRYMELLLEQIRNKRAKELVAREINSHIEDQEEAYLSQGLSAYDAERRAVLDMGEPSGDREFHWTQFTDRKCHGVW